MKLCPRCNMQLEDASVFCPNCGTQFIPNATVTTQPYLPVNPYDHTSEYEAKDIAENKLFAACAYLLSLVGVIVILLAAKDSPFAMFHVRQGLKLFFCELLLGVFSAILSITIIVPVIAVVCLLILVVVQLICFFNTCAGKALEAPIVKNFSFLK